MGLYKLQTVIYIAHSEGYIIQQFIIMFTATFSVKLESKIKLIWLSDFQMMGQANKQGNEDHNVAF